MFSEPWSAFKLRSGGGPRFSSHSFKEFVKRWVVTLVQSPPYYSQSNQRLRLFSRDNDEETRNYYLKNGDTNSENFHHRLLEFRSTSFGRRLSKVKVLSGHPLRSLGSAHSNSFDPKRHKSRIEYDEKCTALKLKVRTTPLLTLKIRENDGVQDMGSGSCNLRGEIIGTGRHREPHGRTMWGNRHYLYNVAEF